VENILNGTFIEPSIILTKKDFGEGHILVTAVTRKHGLIKSFAFGGKRLSKRFKGGLEYFKVIEAEFQTKDNNGEAIFTISSIKEIKKIFPNIINNVNKFITSCYMLELASMLLNQLEPCGKSGKSFFEIVEQHIKEIEEIPSNDIGTMVNIAYELCIILFNETGFTSNMVKINNTKEQLYRMEQLHSSILNSSPKSFVMMYELLNNSCSRVNTPEHNRR